MKHKLLYTMLLTLVYAQNISAFLGGVSGCCALACAGIGASITAGTGGISLPIEISEVSVCIAECVATGGMCGWIVPPIPPFPCCIWAWILPF